MSERMDRQQHTTYSHDAAATRVTVTRRHHPLHGQMLDLVKPGRTQIVVRLGNGTSMRLPSAWTDVDGDPSQHTTDGNFTADALRALLDLVDALCARDRH
jgi:hypothetical protein